MIFFNFNNAFVINICYDFMNNAIFINHKHINFKKYALSQSIDYQQ